MRVCKTCQQLKSIEAFKKHCSGYRHVCKVCQYAQEKNNDTAYNNSLARKRKYRHSPQGKLKAREYLQREEVVEARKISVKKYETTESGRLRKYVATAKRRAARIQRTPNWLTDEDRWLIKEIYELALLRTKQFGFNWHVDHIIPLQGITVSGLHVPENMRVITWLENQQKHNKVNT